MTSTHPKVALVTGVTGQDGSYLAEFLLGKGYTVHGMVRRSSSLNTSRIQHLLTVGDSAAGGGEKGQFFLHYGDMGDSASLADVISRVRPAEVYNLAAQSHVQVSFEMAEYTSNVDALGALRLLEALRTAGLSKSVRFYQASTSELFGAATEFPQSETTPFYPRSPYAIAKQFAYWITVNYREAYGMFAVNGLLFNHESPRRGSSFVTRKTTLAVARIALGQQDCLHLGNLDACRDWGHARDYVESMWLMLNADAPGDWVVATGEMHTVREFVECAFAVVGRRVQWEGTGVNEVGKDQHGSIVVRVDPQYYRPTETDRLQGNASKIRERLGWRPKTSFEALVGEMVRVDLDLAKQAAQPTAAGANQESTSS